MLHTRVLGAVLQPMIGRVARALNLTAASALAALLLATGCGDDQPDAPTAIAPSTGVQGTQTQAAQALGLPLLATKNTTRVAGADPTADAAGVAQAVFPSMSAATRPPVVALAPAEDWRAAIAAAVLMARPVRAPLLLAAPGELPAATTEAIARLAPRGSGVLGGAQAIRVGEVPAPPGLRAAQVTGADPFALAAAVDRLATRARGKPSETVVVAGADDPAHAMPAAAWAAKSGSSVLFTRRDALPAATIAALRRHRRPRILVLGPPSVVSSAVARRLRALGSVTRVAGATPQETAIALARSPLAWGVVDPGHGLVFANPAQPAAAAAAAPLSSSGTYGPLLLVADDGGLPDPVVQYLLDIQPGYEDDPVRGVYNHGWLIGDAEAIGEDAQSRIDALLEISPVTAPSP